MAGFPGMRAPSERHGDGVRGYKGRVHLVDPLGSALESWFRWHPLIVTWRFAEARPQRDGARLIDSDRTRTELFDFIGFDPSSSRAGMNPKIANRKRITTNHVSEGGDGVGSENPVLLPWFREGR
jgi:hypothetical protein